LIEKSIDVNSIDVRKLGLKVGLEIHQQLNTKHKLFCHCPTSLVREEASAATIIRQLRPTRSELGEVDVAALFEWRKGRMYKYHAPLEASCLVEADEEPPHSLNREAVIIALAIAKALGSRHVDEIHVMRKIVIDGSNTTGFQRTAIVALGGSIKLSGNRRVGIQSIAVEEDAARKIGERGVFIDYNLDRLGIPLIEISTEPDIEDPEEVLEAAQTIGMLLRLTGRVKRGIGTIRQDLNVSIRGGAKIEIKGVQRLELLPKIVLYEAIRQYRLLEIRDELARRNITKDKIADNASIVDVTKIFSNTRSKTIKRALKQGGRVMAVKLYGFHGILGVEVQPGRRFGSELADYARFWGGVGGLFHTDELPGYGISQEEVEALYTLLEAVKGRDAIVIVADKEERAKEALKAVVERALQALEGVPAETRAAQEDGTTRFMRPQPGSARMYPETDIPPLEVTEELLIEANKLKPPHPADKIKELVSRYGISRDLAEQLLKTEYLDLFEELARLYTTLPASYIASVLTNTLRSLKREGIPVERLTDKTLKDVIGAIASNKIAKEAAAELLAYLARHPDESIESAMKVLGLGTVDKGLVEKLIDEAIERNMEVIRERGMAALSRVMGYVMPRLRGRVDGRVVADMAREKIKRIIGA